MQSDHPGATAAAIASAEFKVNNPTPELAEAIERGYEPKDISLRGLFIFLGSLIVTLALVLVVIYGIMMALVEHDRSKDPKGTVVRVERGPMYAPLQPSWEHPTEDWQDMTEMRQYTQRTLNTAGVSQTGRRFISIDEAMDKSVPLLVAIAKPATTDAGGAHRDLYKYPEGTHEGVYVGSELVK